MLKSSQVLFSIAEIRLKKARSAVTKRRQEYSSDNEEFTQLVQKSRELLTDHETRRTEIRVFLKNQARRVADINIAAKREAEIQQEQKDMERKLFEKKEQLKASEVALYEAETKCAELANTCEKRRELLRTFTKERKFELEARSASEMEELSSVRSAANAARYRS